jgi:hypothetical protein
VERARSRDSVNAADDEEPLAKKSRGKRAGSVKPKTGGRKGGRKKAPADYAESTISASDTEPSKRGRKRSSSVFDSKEPVILFDGRASTDEDEIIVQPKKQRATRASIARGGAIDTTAPPKRQRATRASIARHPTVDYGTLTDAEDSVASRPIKGRRTVSKNLKTATKSKAYIPVDGDFDNSLVQDEPLTDEDDSASLQKPFVRNTKRVTKSRTSLMVEQQMRDAPNDVLIPTASKGKGKQPRAGPRAPSANVVASTPMKPFFRGGDQDFSMPVSVPRHLNRDIEVLDQHSDTPSEVGEDSAPEPPAKKTRGRPRKNSVVAEASKPKRAKVSKKKAAMARSRGDTVESEEPQAIAIDSDDATPAEPIQSPLHATEPKQTEEPKRRRKKQYRESMASLVSTIPDDPAHPDVSDDQSEHAGDSTIPDEEPDGHSDAGSIVHHVIEIRDTFNNGKLSAELPVEVEQQPEPDDPITKPTRKSPRKSSPAKAGEAQIEETAAHRKPSVPSFSSQENASSIPESAQTQEMPIDHDTDVSEVFLPESLNGTPLKHQNQSPDRAERQSSERSRPPLSPVRRQLTVPLVSTPKEKGRTLQSSRPWSPVDLDAVFAAHEDDEELSGLTAAEREMTVEEWVKWNSANGERRLNERAERMIAMFEEKGREARACIEGIPTTS